MNADQKQCIAQAVSNWRSYDLQEAETVTENELSAMCSSMAALLQELIDAPVAEPVAKVMHVDGLNSNNLLDCDLPTGTLLYTATPAPRVPDGWQPIETAPKDNKRSLFLACFNDDGTMQAFDYDGIWQSERESWELPQVYYYWATALGNVEEPTHWMYEPEWFSKLNAAQPRPNPPADLVWDKCQKHNGGLTIAKTTEWDLSPWSGDNPDREIDAAIERDKLKGQS